MERAIACAHVAPAGRVDHAPTGAVEKYPAALGGAVFSEPPVGVAVGVALGAAGVLDAVLVLAVLVLAVVLAAGLLLGPALVVVFAGRAACVGRAAA